MEIGLLKFHQIGCNTEKSLAHLRYPNNLERESNYKKNVQAFDGNLHYYFNIHVRPSFHATLIILHYLICTSMGSGFLSDHY